MTSAGNVLTCTVVSNSFDKSSDAFVSIKCITSSGVSPHLYMLYELKYSLILLLSTIYLLSHGYTTLATPATGNPLFVNALTSYAFQVSNPTNGKLSSCMSRCFRLLLRGSLTSNVGS